MAFGLLLGAMVVSVLGGLTGRRISLVVPLVLISLFYAGLRYRW